ncbi:MAG: thymidine phosphorylase [Verrucomicrobiales bacterium]|nr:thymidine phosphorylase [Verrucomicrobiales bacterium]
MHIPTLIERKRDGGTLSDGEIRDLITAYTSGEMPDYQMSAMAMAIYFQGMTADETASMTRAMLESGEVLSFPENAPRIVDKHSTGGVGDKVSLILAPLLACDDVWVPMISGRGLGITGGTLDKLESIPGFRVDLSQQRSLEQLEKIGVVMIGQTASICPADKKLYALRDVTATVPSRPLIVASIMSKKLAESLDALVLDVKFGTGAFMKTREDAEALGEAMREVGAAMGVDTSVCYHPMDEPLGCAVGNALEVVESLELLRGGGPADLREVTLALAEKVSTVGRSQLESWLDDGSALRKFEEMVECQGGDAGILTDFPKVHPAKVVKDIMAPNSGVIEKVDADTVGRASLALGAGRGRSDDVIDFSVGFDRIAKVGSEIKAGDCVARVHANSDADAALAEEMFWKGYRCV